MIFFFLIIPPPPRFTLFPYTTLFRSLIMSGASDESLGRIDPGHTSGARRAQSGGRHVHEPGHADRARDRKSTRLNSSHEWISYAVFCLKKKKHSKIIIYQTSNIHARP